ncbi:hypothetical protein PUN28_004339 [Cardiocondyla obscurior]|uniref:Exosome complex component RRP40 n=1 Tax=Cardiocondyla obscurior TaxID=286306 RepID=A0AAW2GFC8_9HYME
MEINVDDTVMPGDSLGNVASLKKEGKNEKEVVILGPGLRREGEAVLVCKAGILRKREPAVYYVDSYQKRYVPSRGENVVGIVTQKSGDIYKVDIGGSEQATLSYLAFEGATKKNRPDIQIGDVVYAKLLVANKDMEPELVCVDSQGKENDLGVLSSDGMMFTCSLSLVRKLLNPECPLFRLLGRNQAYELAAGLNGRIWIKAPSVKETIAVANAILAAEYTVPSEMQKLCNKIEKILILIS